MAKKKANKKANKKVIPNRHDLYEASVQSVDADLDFFERVYKRKRGRRFVTFREDFCGTAVLSCEWVRRRKENRAWGVDLHVPTLEWGRKNRLPTLGDDAGRRFKLLQNPVQVAVIGSGSGYHGDPASHHCSCLTPTKRVLP